MFCGVGVTDIPARTDGIVDREWRLWSSMLSRCYSEKYQKAKPTYKGCHVDEHWLIYSNFKKDIVKFTGFNLHDWQFDKDILVFGNRVYSKDTCCFVPREVNQVFLQRSWKRCEEKPVGVYYDKRRGVFTAKGNVSGKQPYLGAFKTETEAIIATENFKVERCKYLAEKYKNLLDVRVYEKLITCKVAV